MYYEPALNKYSLNAFAFHITYDDDSKSIIQVFVDKAKLGNEEKLKSNTLCLPIRLD